MRLRQHPLCCGLLLLHIKILTQELSIALVNTWDSILSTEHLHNRLSQEKLISHVWRDMDAALAMHNVNSVVIGALPTSMGNYFERFSLAIGYPATALPKDQRNQKAAASKAGPGNLGDISAVSSMFEDRYCGEATRTCLSFEDAALILKEGEAELDEDCDDDQELERKTPRIVISDPDKRYIPSKSGMRKDSTRAVCGR